MIPRATYRLQFHKEFPFAAALQLAPYLQRLGISHVYASPILKARAGSLHGYDVVDPGEINPELGGEAAFRALSAELRAHGLGIVLDIVPNHMAVDSGNRWWMDVLEHGRGSRFADYFDIDWAALDGKVLIAVLGKPYWEALEAGDVRIGRNTQSGKAYAEYFDRQLPLRPEDRATDPDDFASPGSLHALLERQHWRLAWWRTANDIINWRRFFDVPDLIALNQDNDAVFEATHAKIFALYREGLIDGVRVDHVDGLADPARYCRMLRRRLDELSAARREPDPHPYIVVEKILGAGEMLPADWGVDGTTGYDFMNAVSALAHDPAGAAPLAHLWRETGRRSADFEDEEVLARGEIARGSFESALSRTTDAFFSLAESQRPSRDLTRAALRRALIRIMQSLRVYRTYATGADNSPASGEAFAHAISEAEHCSGGADRAAISFVAAVIGGKAAGPLKNRVDAVRRFNQLSAPVAAKAVEDTAFYRYGRLLSRNDVGFDPGRFALSPAGFHEAIAERARAFPHTLLATATHDHKRGEDVRARLAVLSEIPEEWARAAKRWMALNAPHRAPSPDAGDEYRLYQMVVGAWPLTLKPDDREGLAEFRERILGWRQKALREAKLRTSWLDPNDSYEKTNADFIRAILDPSASREFLDDMAAFVDRIAAGGALNGLAQTALRCTVPGVPDCYQGTEFWDFSLVDPDNRRPVDYSARIAALREHPERDLLSRWRDGRIKQSLIAALLGVRRDRPEIFFGGTYVPLAVHGPRAGNVVAFLRQADSQAAIVAVPIRCASVCAGLPLPPPDFWADTRITLPEVLHTGPWRHLLDDALAADESQSDGDGAGGFSCRELFARFPVALLWNRS